MSDRDRQAILERRALLLSSALGVVGCGQGAVGEPGSAAGVTVEQAPPVVANAPADGSVAEKAPLPTRDESSGAVPSRKIPEGLSPTERNRFENLHAEVDQIHELLEQAERSLPDSCADSSQCEKRFARSAWALQAADELLRGLAGHGGGSGDVDVLLAARAEKHGRVLSERVGRLRDRATEVGRQAGDAGAWRRAERRARPAPMVCLSVMP